MQEHKEVQAVYSLNVRKLPALKELTADYDTLQEPVDDVKVKLAELKKKLIDLKHIRYNGEIRKKGIALNDHYIDRRLRQNR